MLEKPKTDQITETREEPITDSRLPGNEEPAVDQTGFVAFPGQDGGVRTQLETQTEG